MFNGFIILPPNLEYKRNSKEYKKYQMVKMCPKDIALQNVIHLIKNKLF